MILPDNGKYTIDESLVDSILVHQKDMILKWLNELESCRSRDNFLILKSKILGAVIILSNLWNVFNYSYKAEEITQRINKIRTKHEFKELWK